MTVPAVRLISRPWSSAAWTIRSATVSSTSRPHMRPLPRIAVIAG